MSDHIVTLRATLLRGEKYAGNLAKGLCDLASSSHLAFTKGEQKLLEECRQYFQEMAISLGDAAAEADRKARG